MEYIQLHVTAKPKPINERVAGRTFPPLLWKVLDRALAKKSEERQASGGEFAHALQAVLNGMPHVPPYGNGQASRPMMGSLPVAPTGSAGMPTATPAAPPQPAAMTAQTVPMPKSSALPQVRVGENRGKQPSIGLLIGVAAAFLVVGAALAALFMRFFVK
jgi:serine/threonine-protein kinase